METNNDLQVIDDVKETGNSSVKTKDDGYCHCTHGKAELYDKDGKCLICEGTLK